MDHTTWIGYAFQEHHVFREGPPVCCEQTYPRFAKFCMVCGEELVPSDEVGLTPEFEPFGKVLGPIFPGDGFYPRETVYLAEHISARWFPCHGGFHLVVGISLGGSSSPPGYRGSPILLSTTGAEDGGDFGWSFKTVNKFFKETFAGSDLFRSLHASLVMWASGLVAGPHVDRWEADMIKLREDGSW